MSQIKQLPPNVVNKIAAGEVVERPASVVKELVENAIDAKAKRIDVLLADGGAKRICVTDDGSGIPADQLALATASHATSKIRSDSDLFHVRTLGFRGEALASIASVSHLLIRSRTSQDLAASELEITGGESGQIAPCSGALGTSVDIRDLFYNTPVRRKFLRTTRTELGHCSEAFTRLALAHPEIHFSLTHNDRNLHDLPPAQSWTERIAVFFGRELAESLIPIENREGDVHLTGYVAHPHHSRGHQRMQYLLLNGRFIRDRSLQHALGEAYRGLLLKGRYPICFLRLELPAE
ncbi:MAG: DNA mismatch repair endonuclease MutL, partial [Pirellulaceae bacterium]|nr:DNA mismatch repair endonuclease MutL [Pirellulaceae bacterium]